MNSAINTSLNIPLEPWSFGSFIVQGESLFLRIPNNCVMYQPEEQNNCWIFMLQLFQFIGLFTFLLLWKSLLYKSLILDIALDFSYRHNPKSFEYIRYFIAVYIYHLVTYICIRNSFICTELYWLYPHDQILVCVSSESGFHDPMVAAYSHSFLL